MRKKPLTPTRHIIGLVDGLLSELPLIPRELESLADEVKGLARSLPQQQRQELPVASLRRLQGDTLEDCWAQIFVTAPVRLLKSKTLLKDYPCDVIGLVEEYLDYVFTIPPLRRRGLTLLQRRACRLYRSLKSSGIHLWLTPKEIYRVLMLHPVKNAKEVEAILSRGYRRRTGRTFERRKVVYLRNIIRPELYKAVDHWGPDWSGRPLRFWVRELSRQLAHVLDWYSFTHRVKYVCRGKQPRKAVEKRRIWRRTLRKLLLKHPKVHYIWGRVYWGDEYAGHYPQSPPLPLPPKDAPLPVKIHCVMSHREFRRKLPNDNFSVWAPTIASVLGESPRRVRSYLRWWVSKMCAGDHILFKRFPFLADSIRRALRANWEDFSSWWRSEVEDLRAQGVVDYPSVSSCAIKLTQYLLGPQVNVNTRYALVKAVSRVIRCMPEFTVTRRPGGLRGRRGYVVRRIRQFHRNLNRSTFVQAHRRLHLIKKLFPQQLWKRIRWRNSWLWNAYLEIQSSCDDGYERRRISVSGYVPGGCSFIPPVFSHARASPSYRQGEPAMASTVQGGGPPPRGAPVGTSLELY